MASNMDVNSEIPESIKDSLTAEELEELKESVEFLKKWKSGFYESDRILRGIAEGTGEGGNAFKMLDKEEKKVLSKAIMGDPDKLKEVMSGKDKALKRSFLENTDKIKVGNCMKYVAKESVIAAGKAAQISSLTKYMKVGARAGAAVFWFLGDGQDAWAGWQGNNKHGFVGIPGAITGVAQGQPQVVIIEEMMKFAITDVFPSVFPVAPGVNIHRRSAARNGLGDLFGPNQ